MNTKQFLLAGVSVLGAVTVALPAMAQKSKDTLRVGFYQPVRLVDTYFQPGPEASLATRMVFDNLMTYDPVKRIYLPGLAESWKRIDAKTMEFKLKKGSAWSDGTPLTMDDVEYTYSFAMDPKVKYRFKATRINWIDSFQRVSDDTFRIKAKVPMAVMLAKMTNFPAIYPKHVHGKLAKKNTFGLNAVGSGPFKVAAFDPAKGITLIKNDKYNRNNPGKPSAQLNRVKIFPRPDEQSQVASLLTGKQDVMYNMDKDQALELANHPDIRVDVQDSVSFSYMMFDVKGRSGFKHFGNPKVRRALMHAVDRKELRKLVHPAITRELGTGCHPWVQNCNWSVEPPKFDPALAKRMLADAGLANGFKIPILTWGEARSTAEAVAGQLRKIGIKASVKALSFGSFIRARAKGEPLLVTLWDNSVGQPDIDNTASYFYLPSSRNYNKDPELQALATKGRGVIDPKARGEVYKELFDQSTKRSYLMPLIPLPAIVAHHKSVKLLGGHKNPKGFEFNRVAWN